MTARILVNQKLIEVSDLRWLDKNPLFEELLGILFNVTERLEIELRHYLLSLTGFPVLPKPFKKYYYQDKHQGEGYEVLLFRNIEDYEIYALGVPEKIAPLLKPTEGKEEVLRISSKWVRQGFKPYLVGFLDSAKRLGSLHPAHLRDKLYFSGLIGIDE